jgi:hypothetical protein
MNLELSLNDRIDRLERAVRRAQQLSVVLGGALLVTLFVAARRPNLISQDVVRTKLLVVEDSAGRDRIVLGAPMPDRRGQVGMKILEPAGEEQFGLGLKADGSVSMGFDTKPGVGNPANRERLNMGVSPSGRGWIRFLDNETRAKMFILLDQGDNGVVQFLDWTADKRITVKEQGFKGQREFEWK